MDIYERILTELAGGNTALAKGPGAARIIIGTNPAANGEVAAADFAVPAGKVWVPLSFTVVCAQGITQTPLPALAWDDGTNVLGSVAGAAAPLSVSTTARFTWLRKLQNAPTAGVGLTANTAVLPDLWLPAGYRLSTITAGIGAATDYGIPVARVLEFSAL